LIFHICVDADDPILRQVKIDKKKVTNVLKNIRTKSDIPDGEELMPLDNISGVLVDVPHDHLHIVVQIPFIGSRECK